MRIPLILLAGALTLPWTTPARAQSGTDIWLVRVDRFAGGVRLGRPVNVTDRPGYDNQPAFLPDGSGFLYTSIGEDGQADTWRFDLRTRTTERVTATAESEYSPARTPDGGATSVVRVEADSTQRLWRFDGEGRFEVIFPDLAPVGYYAWLTDTTAALFVLGDPPALVRQAPGIPPDTLARDIGRTIAVPPPGLTGVSFVQRVSDDERWVSLHPLTGDSVRALARLPGSEFFAWTPDGALLAADGSRLLLYRMGAADWTVLADFADAGLTDMTRIAMSPDGEWLALVAADPA